MADNKSSNWRALIVDDESPARFNLEFALTNHNNWLCAGSCGSVNEARSILASMPVDLVFLDVQMPRENGFVLARELSKVEEPPLVIFVTAYDRYALEAFDVHALDYLLKPFDNQRFEISLQRAEALLNQRQKKAYGDALRSYIYETDQPNTKNIFLEKLSVRSVGKIESVLVDDVLWMRAAGNYVELHTLQRMILHRIPISQLAERLDPARFIRVHRSILIDIKQAAVLTALSDDSHQLTLRCGAKVPVSERYLDHVRQMMNY